MVHLGAAASPLMKDKTFVAFRSHLSYIRKHHSLLAAGLYYLAMGMRLTGATCKQMLRYFLGRCPYTELRKRFERQMQFMLLRAGKAGG
jgi:hypothetical protein